MPVHGGFQGIVGKSGVPVREDKPVIIRVGNPKDKFPAPVVIPAGDKRIHGKTHGPALGQAAFQELPRMVTQREVSDDGDLHHPVGHLLRHILFEEFPHRRGVIVRVCPRAVKGGLTVSGWRFAPAPTRGEYNEDKHQGKKTGTGGN